MKQETLYVGYKEKTPDGTFVVKKLGIWRGIYEIDAIPGGISDERGITPSWAHFCLIGTAGKRYRVEFVTQESDGVTCLILLPHTEEVEQVFDDDLCEPV